ncbi:transmembrane adaptor Erv26-domain-containing protein, partial [Boletus edulis BED1]
ASGLLYISELIEEHSRLAKLIGQRAIYATITLHMLLYVTDSLPLLQTLFSIICHCVYLQNFSSHWPLISLSSISFISSCALAIANHFLWFMHFSHLARDARQSYRHRGSLPNAPGFTDIATFFGICVWLVPLFLFLSLSANDNALPTSSGTCLVFTSCSLTERHCQVSWIRPPAHHRLLALDNPNLHCSNPCFPSFPRTESWPLTSQLG